jgi:hypothetical protein
VRVPQPISQSPALAYAKSHVQTGPRLNQIAQGLRIATARYNEHQPRAQASAYVSPRKRPKLPIGLIVFVVVASVVATLFVYVLAAYLCLQARGALMRRQRRQEDVELGPLGAALSAPARAEAARTAAPKSGPIPPWWRRFQARPDHGTVYGNSRPMVPAQAQEPQRPAAVYVRGEAPLWAGPQPMHPRTADIHRPTAR